MKKRIDYLLVSLCLLILAIFIYREIFQKRESVTEEDSSQRQGPQFGNQKIESFDSAKRKIAQFYEFGKQETFYCGCPFQGKHIFKNACSFSPPKETPRSSRIEWEHVVPASIFGKKFSSWKKGHSRCVSSKGKPYKGRECTRLVSEKFRLMEADMYNLVPAIGSVNQIRSNHPFSEGTTRRSELGSCPTQASENKIYPRKEIKGIIARIYLYMNTAYPGYDIVTTENQSLFEKWNELYPPSENENRRQAFIKKVQGNDFYFESKSQHNE